MQAIVSKHLELCWLLISKWKPYMS